ncbi:hypothetical protein HF638_24445 [Paenibacillus sp. SZ31]|uniref:ABC transporter permease n=1 Tax=Paenibacillus sp. SZ31 TaxID=2725555 RepID=UPI00146DC73F|nr:hypothetical protein [Paenibacillus sp. SZ31]NMI07146.1 hypothetical protein [Paenibacillus sp. SZ31]
MYKLIDSIKNELLLLHRNRWSYLIVLSSLLYFGYRSLDSIRSYQPGEAVNATAYIIQAAIFMFLIYGILLARQETTDESEELFRTINNAYEIKLVGKVIHLIIISLAFSSLHILVLFSLFALFGVPSQFYYASLMYFLLYWVLSFIVCGILGIVLGTTIRSKLVFPIMIIAGIFLGPLNQIVFIAATKTMPVWMQKLMFLINLGQSDPFRVYHIVYGFPVESFRFISKLFIFIMAIILITFVIFNLNSRKNNKTVNTVLLTVLLLSAVGSWSAMSPHLEELTSKQAIKSDNDYYKNLTVKKYTEGTQFIVKNYNMDISINNGLNNKLSILLEPKANLNQLVFSLYHNFKVNSIRFNGENIEFSQEVDYLIVPLSQPLKQSEDYVIEIDYSGYGPQRFFSNQQAVMLPSFLAWYPVPGKQPVAEFIDNYMTIFHTYTPEDQASFSLNYSGPEPLYTNLISRSNGKWEGNSSSGVTLISGDMEEIQFDNLRVVRPFALYNMSDHIYRDISNFIEVYKDINQQFEFTPNELNTLFFIETRMNEEAIWLEDNYAIIDIDILSNSNNAFRNRERMIQRLLVGIVNNYKWDTQDKLLKDLLTNSYSYWYEQYIYDEDKTTTSLSRIYPDLVSSYYPTHSEEFNELVTFLDRYINNKDLIISFFKDWIAGLQSSDKFSWNELQKIIIKYEKD